MGAYRINPELEGDDGTGSDEEEELRADRPQIASAMYAVCDITCLLLGQCEASIPEGHILQLVEEGGAENRLQRRMEDVDTTCHHSGGNGTAVGVCMQDSQF